MLDKDIHFTLRSIVRWDWFGPMTALALFLIFWAVVYACWDTSSVAAWVQAIGSILAIMVAIFIADLGHSVERSRQNRAQMSEEARVAWIAECALGQAHTAILKVKSGLSSDGQGLKDYDLVSLHQSSEMLMAIFQQALPRNVVSIMFVALSAVKEVTSEASRMVGGYRPAEWSDFIDARISTIKTCVKEVGVECKRLSELVGEPYYSTQPGGKAS